MRILYFLFLLFFFSCNNKKQQEGSGGDASRNFYQSIDTDADEDSERNEFSDGTWCAEVQYYNPNTGTRNTYDLDVEVEGGELVQIHWPNGGWLDESHFIAEDITDRECSFTSDKGYRYTVTLNEKGGCSFTDATRMRNDMEDERRISTCPKCGEEKDTYEEMCDDCQDEAETCPKCYGYKMEWNKLCSRCENDLEEQRNRDEDDDF